MLTVLAFTGFDVHTPYARLPLAANECGYTPTREASSAVVADPVIAAPVPTNAVARVIDALADMLRSASGVAVIFAVGG
jgi:hypothetical protein